MPGTTRYSATFDRPYEEEDRTDPPPPPSARRSRSQSWQANSGLDSRPYTPLGSRPPSQRSSSSDSSPSKSTENIPTRTVAKTVVKPHSNPFQFVKVGTCPLYKKAEEQLKKAKEVKKPEVLKEEEEWQSNLDSWKSRRRKMSEDVFRRQEEIKQIELEEQVAQLSQKKTKTFSEMVESRAHRGRALSLSLISSPLELQKWELENIRKNGSHSSFSGESGENSTANSEDEGVSFKSMLEKSPINVQNNHRTNGNSHIENINSDSHNSNYNKLSDISNNSLQMKPKEGSYIDSGLESISSHRAGDTPDSGSDFSHDSGSSIDCESPRTGVNILEEFGSKSAQVSDGNEISVRLCSSQKGQDFGFTFLGGKNEGQVFISSILEGSKADLSSIHLGDQIVSINDLEVNNMTRQEIASHIQKSMEMGEISMQLWRHSKSNINDPVMDAILNGKSNGVKLSNCQMSQNKSDSYEKSIESENEMFVDDFDELQRQSDMAAASKVNDSNNGFSKVNVESKSMNGSVVKPQEGLQNANFPLNENSVDTHAKAKTRRKGVYTLDVQNAKDGFSVSSSFPLSPVTELPTPEDTKTMASTLSSQMSSISKTNAKGKVAKDVETTLVSSDSKGDSIIVTTDETKDFNSSGKNSDAISFEEQRKKDSPTKNEKKISIVNADTENAAIFVKKTKSKPKKECKKLTLKINVTPNEKGKNKSPKTPVTPKTGSPEDNEKKESINKKLQIAVCENSAIQENQSKFHFERSKNKKSCNSLINNSPAHQTETNSHVSSNDSLNIVFQTLPNNANSEMNESSNPYHNRIETSSDILPVEKVAEEMEKLILQQLEEEERAKEMSSGVMSLSPFGSPDHFLTAPPKLVEPPKEKPPPPPSVTEGNPQDSSLKRVNSTKRIKKDIHKRRSNFLGIENDSDNLISNEASIPPPPALEEILKAEMELDRQTRLQIKSATAERLTLEEKELIQKEKEIIETLESEERQKQLVNSVDEYDIEQSCENYATVEEQIEFLKNEQKRLELERINEEQQLRLLEETQLRELKEREEIIRKQEAPVLNSDAIGDGKNFKNSNSESGTSKSKTSDPAATPKVVQKPTVPPKPLKKKEAIRKERERLRQEQEALQREREEHRRKLMQEQDELSKNSKPHAPDVPVSRLGPLPPLVQPSFHPPLTAIPYTREAASFPSRSHHGASNIPGGTGNLHSVELVGPVVAKQGPIPPVRKPLHCDAWGQQKVTSVRKQNQDSLSESRYNQNHWLIQEAEMRRIADLKDRQRRAQLSRSQTNLAEDDVCSNPSRLPVVSTANKPMNYPMQDKMWNYNQPNAMAIKKYPPPALKEPLHVIYPPSQQPPPKPSRVMPVERQEQMLSVSGRKRCSHCNEELGRGAAMIIESLQLYYHIHCFRCCVCQAQLGNGSCGTDVRVRNQKLHCHNCYSNDEAGLKFSQV